MLQISGPRGSGRTTAIAAMASQDPEGLLVLVNKLMVGRVVQIWPSLKNRVVTFTSWNSCRGRRFQRIYIDDLDDMTPKELEDMRTVLAPMNPQFVAATMEGPSLALPARAV